MGPGGFRGVVIGGRRKWLRGKVLRVRGGEACGQPAVGLLGGGGASQAVR